MTVITQLPIFGRHMTQTKTAAYFMGTVLNFKPINITLLDN